MNASFRVEQVASNYTASCRNLLNLRTRKKGDLLLIVRLLFLPMDAGLVTDEQKRGESGEMWVRDEDIRSGQSHWKSNMHFRQRRNAHPVPPNQNREHSLYRTQDSSILIRTSRFAVNKFQADRRERLLFGNDMRTKQTPSVLIIIQRSQNNPASTFSLHAT